MRSTPWILLLRSRLVTICTLSSITKCRVLHRSKGCWHTAAWLACVVQLKPIRLSLMARRGDSRCLLQETLEDARVLPVQKNYERWGILACSIEGWAYHGASNLNMITRKVLLRSVTVMQWSIWLARRYLSHQNHPCFRCSVLIIGVYTYQLYDCYADFLGAERRKSLRPTMLKACVWWQLGEFEVVPGRQCNVISHGIIRRHHQLIRMNWDCSKSIDPEKHTQEFSSSFPGSLRWWGEAEDSIKLFFNVRSKTQIKFKDRRGRACLRILYSPELSLRN